MQVLAGLTVVDFSKVLAGPLCAQYLGELGANVIKVEPVGQGDDTRGWLPLSRGLAKESRLRLRVLASSTSQFRDLLLLACYYLLNRHDMIVQLFSVY